MLFVAHVALAISQESVPQQDAAKAHLGRGYDALRQDQYQVAATEFEAALAQDPSLAERARFPLAVALFEMHQFQEARREFDSLHRELGDHPNILYYEGRLDLESNDFPAAIRELSQAATKPPFPDTVYYLGFAFFKQHDLANAEKWLEVAKQNMPRDSRVEFQLAKVYREQGRNQDANEALAHSQYLRQQDQNDVLQRQDCIQKLDQGLKEARPACEKLYDPDNADRLTSLGTIYGQHGDLNAALRCFQRAAELMPQSPQMQYNVALTYYQLNEFPKARAPLEVALQRWPDLFQLNALYGAVLLKLGESVSAYDALHHAFQLNPQDSGTADLLYRNTLQLAEIRQQAKEYPQALNYLQEAAALHPDQPEPHRRMAQIYSLTGLAARASAELREADRLNASPAK